LPLLSEGTGKPLPVAEACALDADGAREQGSRYRQLSRQAIAVTRSPRSLGVRFSPEVDRNLLVEAVAVERGCCSFLTIHHDPDALTLTIEVDEQRLVPALDAIESALRGR